MTRINLLPWREARRKEQQRQFFSMTAGAALAMGAIVLYIHVYIGGLIDHQNQRNNFLEREIAKVEKKIAEIKDLKSEKEKLLARMNIIQELQTRRPEIVHLFDELARSIPSGLYLTEARQEGRTITLKGVAQSNARVSSFMRNLDRSAWFTKPRLEVIEADDENQVRTSRFVLTVQQASQIVTSAEEGEAS